MSSNIDPAKLKVIDLRNELSSRGLDTKGNKAVLVKRLKNALEKEFDKDLPDTSIADTSTEDLDTSQIKEPPKKGDETPTEKIEAKVDKDDPKIEVTPEKTKPPEISKPEIKSSQKTSVEQKSEAKTESPEKDRKLVEESKINSKSEEVQPKPAAANKIEKDEETAKILEKIKTPEKVQEKLKSPEKSKPEEKLKSPEKSKPEEKLKSPEKSKPEEKPKNAEEKMETDTSETKVDDKSTSSEIEPVCPLEKVKKEKDNKEARDKTSQKQDNPPEKMEIDEEEAKSKDSKSTNGSEQKGEKRKRSSDSPQRSQRRRSRSPVRENEPAIDNSVVQLSWYDSDLHLQIDDKTFLSAKPMTDGVFGYAWAGVRGTHGVQTGKVFYELKLTEEIKWEDDFSKQPEKKNHNKRNSNKRHAENKTSNVEKTEKKVESNTKDEKKEETSAETKEKKVEEKATVDETKEKEGGNESEENSADKCENTESKEEKAQEANAETKMETDEAKSENAESDSKEKDNKVESSDKPVGVSEPIPTHVLRVGWSLLNCSLQLGEEKFSYGYESSGRFVTDKEFVDYGIKFGAGDVVGTFLTVDEDNITIRYAVNGVVQPVATTVPKSDLPEKPVFFPHVLSRNYAFELNLDGKTEPWFPVPADLDTGFQCLGKVEEKVAGPARPENRGDCEVLLMFGLPAAGKTHWVAEHVASNPDKRYCVLGKSNMLEKMTVSGEPLKSKYTGKWSLLIDKMQKCLNKLVALAAHRRRNYIIDQTNVFPSAQRRKMRPFEGFKRKAVIIVVGDEEHARRQSLQEAMEGKEVPDSTILEMKAAMTLPDKGDWIDEVIYVGVDESEAKEIVKKYNEKGKEAGYGTEKKFKDDRWQNRRNEYRGRNYRDRSNYHSQRFESRDRWTAPRPRGGGWNRDRQDTRGPPSREWRGSSRDYHGARSSYNQGYARGHNSRDQGSIRGQGGRGQGRGQGWSGGWGGQSYNQQSSYGGRSGYNNQNWGSGGGGGNQWKYSSGGGGGNNQQGYGSYGSNWNYYGQYSQNWSQK